MVSDSNKKMFSKFRVRALSRRLKCTVVRYATRGPVRPGLKYTPSDPSASLSATVPYENFYTGQRAAAPTGPPSRAAPQVSRLINTTGADLNRRLISFRLPRLIISDCTICVIFQERVCPPSSK